MSDILHRLIDDPPRARARATNRIATTDRIRSILALTATLGLAGACWGLALRQMSGMDMGVSTRLGSFGFFLAVWALMMAAMMLPSAAPEVVRRARSSNTRLGGVLLFVSVYLAVWTAVGLPVYLAYRPHGTLTAGALVITAGLYELTPLKTRCRRRCRHSIRPGEFAVGCVGSSIGLMLTLLAIGLMNTGWMAIITGLVLAQKTLPSKLAIDIPVALMVVALGVLIILAPASIPGLMPSM
jgi:predicted metal-binding membrane protein